MNARASYQNHSSIPNKLSRPPSIIRADQEDILKDLEQTIRRLRTDTKNKAALALRVSKLRSLTNEFLRSL